MTDTLKFTVPSDDKENMRRILRTVFDALQEKGYNPVNQIVTVCNRSVNHWRTLTRTWQVTGYNAR